MTDADPANEQVAQRLAAQGRAALLERLRQAYTQAAEAHADVLSIDADRTEMLVQGAADRADGLQWRRALADVASRELGISLIEALAHPAIVQAQELLGAPSYESSLAALAKRPASEPSGTTSWSAVPTAAAAGEPGPAAVPERRPDAGPADVPEGRREAGPADVPERRPEPGDVPEREPEPEPPWHSIGHADVLASAIAERQDDEPGVTAAQGPGTAPPAAGPTAPPREFELDETIAQPPSESPSGSEHSNDSEPLGGLERYDDPEAPGGSDPDQEQDSVEDPQATQEWTPDEVAAAADWGQEASPAELPEASPTELPETSAAGLPETSAAGLPEASPETSHGPSRSLPPPPTHVVPAATPAPAPLPPETTAGEHLASRDPEPVPADHATVAGWPQDDPGHGDDRADDDPPDDDQHRLFAVQGEEDDRLRVTAIHLGGVANLSTNREGIDLRLSVHGLDIVRSDDEILGRLVWSEIEALEVSSPRVRRRRNRDRARLIIRTGQGDASFEVPGFSSEELHDRIEPLLARFGRH